MPGDDGATLVLDKEERFPSGTYVEAVAYVIPESERYPEGVKYSFQYGTAEGDTVFRYDNFPDHPDVTAHHKHTRDGSVEPVAFDGLQALFNRFKTEVKSNGEPWH